MSQNSANEAMAPDGDPRVQVCYDALHDATCADHGAHCYEHVAQIRDAIRVMLWRLDEAAL